MMHAQSTDEVRNFQTSSIRNSFIKSLIRDYRTILESPEPAPQRTKNQKVEKVNTEKSDLTVNLNASTKNGYISPSTHFFDIPTTPLDLHASKMGG
jgi:hypothetical protein